MTKEEHAAKIREYTKLILRLLAGQKYAEIIPLLDGIEEHARHIVIDR